MAYDLKKTVLRCDFALFLWLNGYFPLSQIGKKLHNAKVNYNQSSSFLYGRWRSTMTKKEEEAKQHITDFLSKRSTKIQRNMRLREISQRQKFELPILSTKNIERMRGYLEQTPALLESSMTAGTLGEDERACYQKLAEDNRYLLDEERRLFNLIVSNITLKHSTSKQDITDTDTLKSVRTMIREGGNVQHSRTGRGQGRQAFVYFLTGVGDFTIDTGLEPLPVCTIDLSSLSAQNRNKYQQLYLSPHLAEFREHVCSDPVVLGGTRLDIQFSEDEGKNKITYHFKRESGESFTMNFSINDFVLYGGDDIRLGTVYYFIVFLRLVGNPYRQEFLETINDEHISLSVKLELISEAIGALLPAVRLWETKAFDDLALSPEYAALSNLPKPTEESPYEFSYGYEPSSIKARFLGDITDQVKSLQLAQQHEKVSVSEEEAYEVFGSILASIDFLGSAYVEGMPEGLSMPDTIQWFALNLVISRSEHATNILKWLCNTSFSEPGSRIKHCVNLNERERTHRKDLVESCLASIGKYSEELCIERLKVIFSHASPNTIGKRLPHYISVCSYHCIRRSVSESQVINFLLSQPFTMTLESIDTVEWLKFSDNQRLLQFLFEERKVDPNGMVEGRTWLEHAIDFAILKTQESYSQSDPFESVNYLLDNGAKLNRVLPERILEALPQEMFERLGISQKASKAKPGSKLKKAVVILVTATNHDGSTYMVVGRRVNSSRSTLENYWSCPGGIIDDGETPEQAARREFEEETTLSLDESHMQVSQLPDIPLEEEHELGVGAIVPIHLHFESTLLMPSVWEASDLYDTRTIRVESCQMGEDGIPTSYCGIPFRPSNALLLHYFLTSKGSEPTKSFQESITDKLRLESNASEYITENVKQLIACRLLQTYAKKDNPFERVMEESFQAVKENEPGGGLESLTLTLKQKLTFAIEVGTDHLNQFGVEQDQIFVSLVNSGDILLLQQYLEKSPFTLDPSISYSFDLYSLYALNQWDMLSYIREHLPQSIYYSSSPIRDFPLCEEAPEEIQLAFKTHGIREEILQNSTKAIQYQVTEEQEPMNQLIAHIKQQMVEHPAVTQKFSCADFMLLLLLGDDSLFTEQVLADFVKADGPGRVLFCDEFDVDFGDDGKIFNVFDFIYERQMTNVLQAVHKAKPYCWPEGYRIPESNENDAMPTPDL